MNVQSETAPGRHRDRDDKRRAPGLGKEAMGLKTKTLLCASASFIAARLGSAQLEGQLGSARLILHESSLASSVLVWRRVHVEMGAAAWSALASAGRAAN